MATFKDFRNNIKPNWCPGCGDFSVQAAIQKACAANGLEPDELAVITGHRLQRGRSLPRSTGGQDGE